MTETMTAPRPQSTGWTASPERRRSILQASGASRTRGSPRVKMPIPWRDPSAGCSGPLRRTFGPRRSDGFEEVSWDDALARSRAGAGLTTRGQHIDILTAHYIGTCSVIANQFPMQFFNHIGATEVNPDSKCGCSHLPAHEFVLRQ